MTNDSILAQIDAEIARLTQARSLLASTGKVATKVIERKTKKTRTKAAVKAEVKAEVKGKSKGKKRRVLSPEARTRIAEAQRKRWAAQKAK